MSSGPRPRHANGHTGELRQMSCWRGKTAADAIDPFPLPCLLAALHLNAVSVGMQLLNESVRAFRSTSVALAGCNSEHGDFACRHARISQAAEQTGKTRLQRSATDGGRSAAQRSLTPERFYPVLVVRS
jgi:hypothetical protein